MPQTVWVPGVPDVGMRELVVNKGQIICKFVSIIFADPLIQPDTSHLDTDLKIVMAM